MSGLNLRNCVCFKVESHDISSYWLLVICVDNQAFVKNLSKTNFAHLHKINSCITTFFTTHAKQMCHAEP